MVTKTSKKQTKHHSKTLTTFICLPNCHRNLSSSFLSGFLYNFYHTLSSQIYIYIFLHIHICSEIFLCKNQSVSLFLWRWHKKKFKNVNKLLPAASLFYFLWGRFWLCFCTVTQWVCVCVCGFCVSCIYSLCSWVTLMSALRRKTLERSD